MKRLLKIYPLHVICFFAAFFLFILFNRYKMGYYSIIPNLLLMHGWIPIRSVYFSFNTVSWCLSSFILFDIVFIPLINYLSRSKVYHNIIWGLVLISGFIILSFLIPENYHHAFFYVNPLFRTIDFILGILLFNLYEIISLKMRSLHNYRFVKASTIEIVSLIILLIFIMYRTSIPDAYRYAMWNWIPLSIIILSFASVHHLGGGLISRILSTRLMFDAGKYTLCFFMIHILVIRYYNTLVAFLKLDIDWRISLGIVFLLTYFFSMLWHNYIADYLYTTIQNKLNAQICTLGKFISKVVRFILPNKMLQNLKAYLNEGGQSIIVKKST